MTTGIDIRAKDTITGMMGIDIEQAGPDLVVLTMPVDGRTKSYAGTLHGAASLVMAQTAAAIGSAFNLDPARQYPVAMEINGNYLRPKSSGMVRARAVPLHKGSKSMVWEIKVMDEMEKMICISRCTMAIVDINRKSCGDK